MATRDADGGQADPVTPRPPVIAARPDLRDPVTHVALIVLAALLWLIIVRRGLTPRIIAR